MWSSQAWKQWTFQQCDCSVSLQDAKIIKEVGSRRGKLLGPCSSHMACMIWVEDAAMLVGSWNAHVALACCPARPVSQLPYYSCGTPKNQPLNVSWDGRRVECARTEWCNMIYLNEYICISYAYIHIISIVGDAYHSTHHICWLVTSYWEFVKSWISNHMDICGKKVLVPGYVLLGSGFVSGQIFCWGWRWVYQADTMNHALREEESVLLFFSIILFG